MAHILEKATSWVGSVVKKAKSGDKVVIIAGAAAAATAIAVVGSFLLAPGDGPKYATQDQKPFFEDVKVEVPGASGASSTEIVSRVQRKDISSAAGVLASGHKSNPLYIAFAKEGFDESARESALHWLFSVLLKATVPSSSGAIALRTVSNDNAVAVWFPSGATVCPSTLFKAGGWQFVFRYSGWDRRGRLFGYGDAIEHVRARIMAKHQGAFFYLLTYALQKTLPDTNRLAALSAVVLPITKRADAVSQPCYVEVSQPEDIPLFAALGFKAAEESGDGSTGSTFTLFETPIVCLKRDPVPQAPKAITAAPTATAAAASSS